MDSVAICNMALGALGQHKINSLADESVAAELCSTFYDAAVDYCLEQKAWLFATEFIDLGAATDTGETEFPKKFVVPTTVVAVHIVDDGSGTYDLKWEQRGLYVFVDSEGGTCKAKVTQRVDPSLYTPTFSWAVAYKLAETIAVPLTENIGAEARMEKKFERELAKGATLDGIKGSSQETVKVLFNRRKLSDSRF